MNFQVTEYIEGLKRWQEEVLVIREIISNSELSENYQSDLPSYTFNNSQVLYIDDTEEYCAIVFIKGALLNDKDKLLQLIETQESLKRACKFTSVDQIIQLKSIILDYIRNAIQFEI